MGTESPSPARPLVLRAGTSGAARSVEEQRADAAWPGRAGVGARPGPLGEQARALQTPPPSLEAAHGLPIGAPRPVTRDPCPTPDPGLTLPPGRGPSPGATDGHPLSRLADPAVLLLGQDGPSAACFCAAGSHRSRGSCTQVRGRTSPGIGGTEPAGRARGAAGAARARPPSFEFKIAAYTVKTHADGILFLPGPDS